MITLYTANMDHDAMHDIYAHPKITSNGIALLEKIGANRWEQYTWDQVSMILSIQDTWMDKQRRKKRGGFLDINRFRTKFLNRGKDRIVPKNTKYAISKLREALRIYGLRVSSTLQEERGDWEQLDQLLNENLIETRYYWGAFSAELLRALTVPTTSVYSLLFQWQSHDQVSQQLRDSIIQKIQGILNDAPHEIDSRISDHNSNSTTVFANPQEFDFRKQQSSL